ncbi:ankyrin repeat domain-containing protein [soil metagenome]
MQVPKTYTFLFCPMAYGILYHNDLDIKSVEKSFGKTLHQLQTGDFKSADLRKMGDTGYYRARLDIRDRLLFNMVQYHGQKYLLLLEVIKDHRYDHSRFLRGAILPDDDKLMPISDLEKSVNGSLVELSYLHPKNKAVHLLNKFISFDELQQSVLNLHPPLVIIGSAGSGKTALVLEKLKSLPGNVAYISLSKYLVENAARIYYAGGYDNENQEADFLSLADYLASWEKPQGREIHFRAFEPWFARHAQSVKINEPYRVYEEFKGVITGSPTHAAWLTKAEYLALGIKQSIFGAEEKQRLYPLFLKYVEWLTENNWYDGNIICHQYLEKIKPRYDFIMVDEVQDITNIQLKCILQSLTNPAHFILTGDSNQIVHPNFFSWAKVKTYFHNNADTGRQIRILQTNYRNSPQVVQISNYLLKIKSRRFGSIDRESNYLVNTISKANGEVLLYPDDEKRKIELNRRTQNSTHFAVIVTDNIYKEEARKHFKTPLVFSVHEAKGLEYENVILVNFVSNHEDEFREIIAGVTPADLLQEELQYNRTSSKYDKDAEIYKFYINSFYVAITRAIKNIYLFEKKANHPALQLLQMQETKKEIQVAEAKSSREEWLEEARRLAEQGKHEQAEQIRAKWLGYEYISPEKLEAIVALALDPSKKEADVKKERKHLFEYAINHQRYDWVEQLASLQFQRAMLYMREIRQHRKEFVKNIRLGRKPEVMTIIKKYGIGFTTDEGANTLMLALHHGQAALASELLKLQAPVSKTDLNGWMALDYLLEGFHKTVLFKHQQMATLQILKQFWLLVKPPAVVFDLHKQRLQVSSHSMLFFLLIAMRCKQATQLNKIKLTWPEEMNKKPIITGAFSMDEIVAMASLMPDEILPPYRKNRSYINSILAANEVNHAGKQNCKMTFKRIQRGWYIISGSVEWVSV